MREILVLFYLNLIHDFDLSVSQNYDSILNYAGFVVSMNG